MTLYNTVKTKKKKKGNLLPALGSLQQGGKNQHFHHIFKKM